MIDILKDKTILVTGGTGSFGSNFVKHLLKNSEVKKVIVFSRDELKQSRMQSEIKDKDKRLRFFLGDVRDLQRLERAFSGVDIVIHAAALKQVPTLEYNPFEAVKTNILGSQNVVDAAIDQGVEKVILISTDKAVQPINLYGSTKLCAEKLFINGNSYAGGKTKFSCVRYGNVIGSRGSIVDILLKKSEVNKVCLTDERMTRFWMTLDQSCQLVLFALANMEGGEIFISKAPSMKLVDLFSVIAPEAEREIIGIRSGEKLHEILLTEEEARHAIELDKYFVIIPEHFNIFSEDRFNKYYEMGEELPIGFSFRCDTNKDCLDKETFKNIIDEIREQIKYDSLR
ncbi:MAG: UDP-N-acetylglucosamine 4,6-dehydratase (inverting) [Patescibacteria group bacterium]|nr:UDP-N-acetylglucosamine 4,6-dehydratase (inverting) [Patescibacteria group bacterium]MDD5294692.1 UDP-N-acetylglucosamine 4,6-dehydratase (inverting) [Patescibacteria group bacterium]MDD5554436.1 UDP-N-acetylglucosamine 4,6-dehydratase (inverting) [Patescibacteria group bacterium]